MVITQWCDMDLTLIITRVILFFSQKNMFYIPINYLVQFPITMECVKTIFERTLLIR